MPLFLLLLLQQQQIGVKRCSKAAEIFLGSHHHHTGHTIFIMGKKFVKFFIKKLNYAASFTKFFIFINFVKLQNELIEDSLEISWNMYMVFFCLTYKVKDFINWVIYMNDISLQINRSSFEKLDKNWMQYIHLQFFLGPDIPHKSIEWVKIPRLFLDYKMDTNLPILYFKCFINFYYWK